MNGKPTRWEQTLTEAFSETTPEAGPRRGASSLSPSLSGSRATLSTTTRVALVPRGTAALDVTSLTVKPSPPTLLAVRHPRLFARSLPTLRIPVLPLPPHGKLLRVGSVLLWPDLFNGEAHFMSASPTLLDLGLIIERSSDFKIVGGSASITLGVHPPGDPSKDNRLLAEWTTALTKVGFGNRLWRYYPLSVSSLIGAVEIPTSQREGDVKVTANSQAGTVSILATLTAHGAQAWHEALIDGAPLTAIARLDAKIATSTQSSTLVAREESISASLSTLVGGPRPNAVRVINPEIEVEAVLYLEGHATVETFAVDMTASTGTTKTEVLDGGGGTLSLRMSSANPDSHRVAWNATVSFSAPSWPSIRVQGVLSRQTGWSDLINPSSWVRQVTVTAVLIGPDGSAIAPDAADDIDLGNRVAGSLDFTAPFLDGIPLQTSFETSSQQTVRLLMPRPPGEENGHLKLTVLSFRNGRDDMHVRQLAADEQWVLIKVYTNARIELVTNRSPASESGPASAIRNSLSVLSG